MNRMEEAWERRFSLAANALQRELGAPATAAVFNVEVRWSGDFPTAREASHSSPQRPPLQQIGQSIATRVALASKGESPWLCCLRVCCGRVQVSGRYGVRR